MSKYGAKKVTIDGITFDSKAEGRYYEHLQKLFSSQRYIQKGHNLLP